jgi:hypothetical protein
MPDYASSEIGVGLTVFGSLFMLLGVMLFFDGALLALGNVCEPLHCCAMARRAQFISNRFCLSLASLLSSDLKRLSISSRGNKKYGAPYVSLEGYYWCSLSGLSLEWSWRHLGSSTCSGSSLNLHPVPHSCFAYTMVAVTSSRW